MDDEQFNDDAPEEIAEDAAASETENEDRDDRSISSDLIRGHINTIILRALCDGDKYGYEISAEIERKSHGQYSIKQPSLYSALKRLEKDGYITSYWGGSVGGGRRKYFSLTDEGREIAERNQSEWEYSRTVIDSLISDKDFDFSNPAPAAVNMRVLRSTTSRVPSRDESDEELNYEPAAGLADPAETERLAREFEEKNAELEAMRAALAEERASFEEEMRRREEEIQAEKAEQDKLLSEREKLLEQRRLEIAQEEQTASEAERAALDERLQQEQERYDSLVHENESALEAERALYEKAIEEREQRLRESEAALAEAQAKHEKELAEQEERIRAEQEELFRRREQQLLHENYVNLVNAPPAEPAEPAAYNYYNAPVAQEPAEPAAQAPAEPAETPQADSGEYRSVVRNIYSNALSPDREQRVSEERAQSLVGVDFSDVEARAARDGLRIVTSGGKPPKEAIRSENLVNRGKALFLSAIVVFFLCIAEGSVAIGIQGTYQLPLFFPYFIWFSGLALLLVTGLLYANHYGERAIRRRGLELVNAIVIYILTVIVTLIVALAIPIDFASAHDLATFIVIPIVFLFGIVIFGICYFLQVRARK